MKLRTANSITRLSIGLGSLIAQAALGEDKAPQKPDLEVTVSEEAPRGVDQVGKASFERSDIDRLLDASGDLNQITRTLAGVQFDNSTGALTGDSILDLSPARLSISGGRVYDNQFQIEGLSTNSVQNTTNTNMHDLVEVVVHPQTGFLDPNLVDSVAVYKTDIPAEFGGFTGGVFSAKLRDPSDRFGAGVTYSYTSDAWVRYLVASENWSSALPEKPRFERHQGSFYTDIPLSKKTGILLGYSKQQATLENTQRLSAYGIYSTRSDTKSENFTSKLAWRLSPQSTLRFTSIWSPYRQENYEQSPKFQDNDSWLNKLEFTRKTSDSTLEIFTGYSWSSTDRDQEANMYTYKNLGSTPWVASTTASAMKGGFGDIISRQTDLPLGARYEKRLTQTGKLALGFDYQFTKTRRSRPVTSNAYRQQTSSTVKIDSRITSADGPNDPTVIEGEQALNYRLTYYAFDARANLNAADAWLQWSDQGKLLGLPWSYRVGLRGDRDDFFSKTNVAPRVSGQINLLSWLGVHAGVNRYYNRALLAYKLRDQYPANYIYTRTGKLIDGKLVYSNADWSLYSMSKTTGYSGSSLDAPYSDELSTGTQLKLGRVGTVDFNYIRRRTKDEFTRDAGTTTSYTKDDGTVATYKVFRMVNGGFTKYDAKEIVWTKKWTNNLLEANVTFSSTRTSTASGENDPDYFDSYSEVTEAETVYYKGNLVPRRQVSLIRDNYARPTYVSFRWSADWFKRRLTTDLLGRWNTNFNRIEQNSTITVAGTKYDLYEDVQVPANLIADLNLGFVVWERPRQGRLLLNLKVGNVFNKLPYSETATPTDPYEEGRSFWSSVSYSF